ncbi:MAG TPA: hypothetical protein VG456_12390 [Candidatus Sulfopaludibacter sp.]|nr:hypothetical protein [Candidatus Sulfopaludibacter sp.]
MISRRSWLLAGLSLSVYPGRADEKLSATFDGDNLHVSAPSLHFLTGKPLQRLKDGATVVYLAQLGLFEDASFLRAIRLAPIDRFAVSYDIWDQGKFSVTMLNPSPRTSPNLSTGATESWCLENMAISASNLAPDRRFWIRLEMRTADQRDLSSVVAGPGISLMEFVLRLGKKAGADDPKFIGEAGPLRLADLARTPGRGPRNG